MSLVFERVDKRADRVEISPEQLSQAAEFTEVFLILQYMILSLSLYDLILKETNT